MGLFSWCTADTRKSISVGMDGYTGAPEKVYLLNPFGEAYEEKDYDGYGVFGGQDVYALVAKWNAPEKCKDENGEWLPDDKIREIGIALACYDTDHVQLKYPIKIVEHLCSYENAGISPGCPYQGYFYDDSVKFIKENVEKSFLNLYAAQEAYQNFLQCNGQTEEFLKRFDFGSQEASAKSFIRLTAKHPETPDSVLMELAEKGDIYVAQHLVENPNLSSEVLCVLEKWMNHDYMCRKIKHHPNYIENTSSLMEKIARGAKKVSEKASGTKEKVTGNKDMSL